jgi:outer membrane protein, multidrug efflux system
VARTFVGLAVSMLLAGGCTLGPDYQAPSPDQIGIPASYTSAGADQQAPEQVADWWRRFKDPVLDGLVDQAVAGNLDLAASWSRLLQAREALVQARSDRVPSLGASASAGQNFDRNGHRSTSLSVGADAAWEADLFGGISRNIEAARAEAQASGYDLAAVRVALIAEVATNYVNARLAQERLKNAQDELAITDENLQIAQWRVQAGLASSLDAEQARSQRAQTAATIPTIESNIAGAAYRLAVLTGRAPGAVADALGAPAPIPIPPTSLSAGIPADTLRQRPDVRASERSLAAATARIGVAEAQLYPSLRLTGNIGSNALTLGSLADNITGGLLAGLTQTIFDGGRLRSQVRSQRAAAQGALASYRQSVLTALEDVENALVAVRAARARQQEFAVALDAASNSAILARSQYRTGLTDFQTLLEAERSLLSARDGLTSARADEALAVVQLYRALGGGWNPMSAPETGQIS